jgi:hypothetical protein
MDVKIDCNWKNILLLNYAVFKTIVHVLVLYQTSNELLPSSFPKNAERLID